MINLKSKGLILIIMLTLILTIGVVSASDYTNSSNIENTNEITQKQVDTISTKTIYNEKLSDSQEVTVNSYSELSNEISNIGTYNYDSYTINLASGNYNATGDLTLSSSRSTGSLRNITINGNGITIDGGNNYSFLTVTGYTINLNNIRLNNFNSTSGSVIYATSSNITLNNSHITNNNVNNYGAIYFTTSNLNVYNTTFENNSAGNGTHGAGGAIYSPFNFGNYTLNITDSTFINNTALANGGTISLTWSYGVKYNITNSQFLNNSANNGGAISIYSSNGTITDCNFTGNYADVGATIQITTSGSTNITNCIIENNTATSGIIHSALSNSTIIANFTNNSATTGIIYLINTNVNLTNSNLTNNTADNGIVYTDKANSTLSNNNITNNTVNNTGYIVYCNDSSNVNITNNKFEFNSYGAGDIGSNESEVSEEDNSYDEVIITKKDTNITINDIETTLINSNITITGNLTSENERIGESIVRIIINGIEVGNTTTDENGTYTYTYTTNKTGTNNISVVYDETDSYNSSTTNTTFNVTKRSVKINVNSITAYIDENITLHATIVDEESLPVNEGYIIFKISGKTLRINNRTDNSSYSALRLNITNGTVSYTINASSYLKYSTNITVSYSGSSSYYSNNSESNPANLTLNLRLARINLKLNTSVVKQNQNLLITVNVNDITGDNAITPNYNSKAVITLKLNGITLKDANGSTIKININGSANYTFKIPSGMFGVYGDNHDVYTHVLTVVYFHPDYESVRNTTNFTIEIGNVTMKLNATYNQTSKILKITGNLTDYSGVNLITTTIVNVKINGITYKNSTNDTVYYFVSDGVVNINIALSGIYVNPNYITCVTAPRYAYYKTTQNFTVTKKS